MNWFILIIAGIFEVGFASCIAKVKETTGTTAAFWFSGFILCLSISIYLLYRATQTLPIGTSYAVWTGIGLYFVGKAFFVGPMLLIAAEQLAKRTDTK